MSSRAQRDLRTRLLARVLGPYLVIVTIVFVSRAPDVRTLFADVADNALVPWAFGAFTLLAGCVVMALHLQWHGAAAIIVSIFGIHMALEGVGLMAFPTSFISIATSMADGTAFVIAGAVIAGVVGLYLTYVGWRPSNGTTGGEAHR